MDAEISHAIRAGRFSEASKIVQRHPFVKPEVRCWKAEVDYYLGHLDHAATAAEELLCADIPEATKAKAMYVLSSVYWEWGESIKALQKSQRAYDLANESSDRSLVAAIAISLLERRSIIDGFDASLPIATAARKLAFRSGDSQTLALLHLVHGRLEARAGHIETAQRHFSLATRLLALERNLWIEAAIFLDRAHVFALSGNLSSAILLAQRGSELARESGWSKGIVAGAANLASLHLARGETGAVQNQLGIASQQPFLSPAYDCALTETAAKAALERGDLTTAESLLAKCLRPDADVPRWYRLQAGHTLVRCLTQSGRFTEALALADKYLEQAVAVRLTPCALAFRISRLEILAKLKRPVCCEDIPFESISSDSGPSEHIDFYRGLGSTLAIARPDQAIRFTSRATRISNAICSDGNLAGSTRREVERIDQSVDVGEDLDSAVALLELAGHPHVLGPEAFALIDATACAEAVALVTAGPAGRRVVQCSGWTASEAAAATSGVEELPIGRRSEETWTLVVRPKRALESFCAFAAIRKLLAFAVSLEGYRRDEKQRAALWPADALDSDPECIWASEQMAEQLTIARRIAPTPLSVLVTGETGTGKEMIARAIHRASDRADHTFLPFNCAAVPRDMLESQLFGYRRGAFTGADASFPGVIRSAAGGTLFLDEIGEIGLDVQPKLLRFLETHEIHPLGEPQPIKVDVRIVAATNASVEQLVAAGRFREDLFYRLNIVRLSLPPLRERREEIPPLVQYYLRKYSDEQRKGQLTLSDETLEYLLLFSWPGNVRQLANEVRRIVALAEPDAAISPSLLSPEIQASRRTIPAAPAPDVEARVALDQPLPAAVEMLEQMMVRRALDRTHGRVEEASRLLGISRKGLFLKRRRWGLSHAS